MVIDRLASLANPTRVVWCFPNSVDGAHTAIRGAVTHTEVSLTELLRHAAAGQHQAQQFGEVPSGDGTLWDFAF